jgi:hypothetical protein
MVEYTEESGEIISVSLNGESLDSDDGESWHTPKTLLKGIKVDDLPEGVSFALCEKIQDGTIFLDSIPVSLSRIASGRLRLSFEDGGTRNYGKREYGKDIVFSRLTEFEQVEHWAAQVKFGDIRGEVNSEIDEVFSQIEDAFKMPFYDLYSKTRVHPSKVCVIISGEFTENAIEKICEKIESHAMRNNVLFVDGARIDTLSEKFRRK